MSTGGVVTILSSAARTATGQSASVTVPDWQPADPRSVSIFVNVTAQSGTTPTLDIAVQWSVDGTNWYPVDGTADSISQYAAVTGLKAKQFTVKGPYYRISYVIAGTTPSYTFDVKAAYQP